MPTRQPDYQPGYWSCPAWTQLVPVREPLRERRYQAVPQGISPLSQTPVDVPQSALWHALLTYWHLGMGEAELGQDARCHSRLHYAMLWWLLVQWVSRRTRRGGTLTHMSLLFPWCVWSRTQTVAHDSWQALRQATQDKVRYTKGNAKPNREGLGTRTWLRSSILSMLWCLWFLKNSHVSVIIIPIRIYSAYT